MKNYRTRRPAQIFVLQQYQVGNVIYGKLHWNGGYLPAGNVFSGDLKMLENESGSVAQYIQVIGLKDAPLSGKYISLKDAQEIPIGTPAFNSNERIASDSSSNDSGGEVNSATNQNGVTEPSNPSADTKQTWISKNREFIATALRIIIIILILVFIYRVWKDNK